MPGRRQHILLMGGLADRLVRFRLPLIAELIGRGWDVTAVANGRAPEVAQRLQDLGANYVPLPINRTGINPLEDVSTFRAISRIVRERRPDVFLGYTLKPAIYGILAARLAGVRTRVAMLEGLGYAFSPGREPKRLLARAVATLLLHQAIPRATSVVVLNRDDERFLRQRNFLRQGQRLTTIPGIGVDLERFSPAPMPGPPIRFLMISRLLRDKGIYEYVEAARLVKQLHPRARFELIGPLDPNPSGVKAAEVAAWANEGVIEYGGEVQDVRPQIAACHVLVLPSYYREGFPVTPTEAFATGRPVIVTDVPGCREIVTAGRTGWLVRPRDPLALRDAMIEATGARLADYGAAALADARERFSAVKLSRQLADLLVGPG